MIIIVLKKWNSLLLLILKKFLNLPKKINNWDNLGIYRSSLVYENGKYYIFYSANSKKHTQGIGLKVKEKLY